MEWWNRKDGVEEVGETGLVNKWEMKEYMFPVCRVYMEFTVVVEGNRDTNDKSIWEQVG